MARAPNEIAYIARIPDRRPLTRGGPPIRLEAVEAARRGGVAAMAPFCVTFVGEEGPWQAHPWEIQGFGWRHWARPRARRRPEELLRVEEPLSGERVHVVPGQFRQRDVKVGSHVAVSPGAVPGLLRRLERGYGGLGKMDAILSVAAAHHRLLWIHPFLDGNGCVGRLLTALLLCHVLRPARCGTP